MLVIQRAVVFSPPWHPVTLAGVTFGPVCRLPKAPLERRAGPGALITGGEIGMLSRRLTVGRRRLTAGGPGHCRPRLLTALKAWRADRVTAATRSVFTAGQTGAGHWCRHVSSRRASQETAAHCGIVWDSCCCCPGRGCQTGGHAVRGGQTYHQRL